MNPQTGTLTLEAAFPNGERLLRPGQFAKIRAVTEVLNQVVAVPRCAVREVQGQRQVYVVPADGVVVLRNVEVGPEAGDMLVITKGIEAGERVVVEPNARLRAGVSVTAKEGAGA